MTSADANVADLSTSSVLGKIAREYFKPIAPPRVGDLAVDLGFLSPQQARAVLEVQRSSKRKAAAAWRPRGSTFLLGGGWMALLAVATVLSGGRAELIGLLQGVATVLILGAWRQPSHRLLLRIAAAVMLQAGVFLLVLLLDVVILDRPLLGLTLDQSSLRGRTLVAGVVLGAGVLLVLGHLRWDRFRGLTAEARATLLQSLLRTTLAQMPAFFTNRRTLANFLTEASVSLEKVARILELSPWLLFIRRVTFWIKPSNVGISLWYFEPTTDVKEGFRTLLVVAPTAPADVVGVFESIRDKYKPVRFQEEAFRQLVGYLRKGVAARSSEAVLNTAVGSGLISVPGWVYAKSMSLLSGDAKSCTAFDSSYATLIDQESFNKWHMWLDFNSFIAVPVVSGSEVDSRTHGVLVACSGLRNAFAAEDVETLNAAASVLGVMRHHVTESTGSQEH